MLIIIRRITPIAALYPIRRFKRASVYMLYTRVVVALLGPPWVKIRTVSKTLKELIVRIISVKNN